MSLSLIDLTLATGICAAALMAVLWFVQRQTKDAGIVDVAWAASLGLAAIAAGLVLDGHPWRRAAVAVLGSAWSLRLAGHLLVDRILRAAQEDGRYLMLREKWGASADAWFFVFFQAQASFVVAFALPFFAAASNSDPLGPWDALGLSVWLVAIVGERTADRQLAAFRRDPVNRGRTCRVGLWNYSRHPNYFFEWLHWWAWLAFSVGSPVWWISAAGVLFMLFLLFYVTGIPYTEKRALLSRGNDYRHYQETTSVFVPWFPGKGPST